ncbi:hypothetical protein LDVICp113 [lymphocystis disease virus-China]|uniref:Uncharacterized protein n=1 Tax=lymphocystis disease virus-China TaxID=256729 RepID=Q677Z9_9VIRU|nr:hypothetical protein LDVICp113 [lymphocystis disease virus-China]AAU10958.1 hypothetical protein [lymphocystis disease virus-China]
MINLLKSFKPYAKFLMETISLILVFNSIKFKLVSRASKKI